MKTRCCSVESLQRLLEHQLSVSEESEVVLHLSHCQDCRKQLESLTAEPEFWRDVGDGLRPTSDGSDSFSTPQFKPSDSSSAWNEVSEKNSEELSQGGLSASSNGQVSPLANSHDSAPTSATILEPESSSSQNPNEQTAAIQFIRQWLAPTDEPSSMGRLGSYEISGIIGIGGMGVVLKGFDPSLHRSVAIKVLGSHLTTSGAARKRFAREAQAAASVVHENVLAIHAIDQWQGVPYFVMPLVRGESLEKRLKQNGPFDLIEILRIARQVAAGLDAAHQQGLVHRDIKPANVLMEHGSQRLTISDFGLARAGDDASLTRSGLIMGTPLYMSPEQAKGDRIDSRSDIFSFGAMLYALCTGHPPFRAETPYGVIRRLCEEDPRPIQQYNSAIPYWFSGIVGQMMQKDVERRIQNVGSLLEVFTVALAYAQQPFDAELPKLLEPFARRPQGDKTVQQNRRGLIAGLSAVACLLVLATVVIVGSYFKATELSDNQLAQSGSPNSSNLQSAQVNEQADPKRNAESPQDGQQPDKEDAQTGNQTDSSKQLDVGSENVSDLLANDKTLPKEAEDGSKLVADGDWRYSFKLDERLRYRCNLELFSKSNVMQVTATIELQTVEVGEQYGELNYEVQIGHTYRQRNDDDPELWTAESSRPSIPQTNPTSTSESVATSIDPFSERGRFHALARPRAFYPGVFIAPPMEIPFFADHFGFSRTHGPFDFELRELQTCEPSGRVKVSASGGVLGSSHQSNLPGQIGPIVDWIFPALGERGRDTLWRYQRELQLVAADSSSRIGVRETISARRSAEFQLKPSKNSENKTLEMEFVITDWNKDQADSAQSSPLQTVLGSISLDKLTGKLERLSMSRSPIELSPELQNTNVHQLRMNIERVEIP